MEGMGTREIMVVMVVRDGPRRRSILISACLIGESRAMTSSLLQGGP